jgi:hypothetical protein
METVENNNKILNDLKSSLSQINKDITEEEKRKETFNKLCKTRDEIVEKIKGQEREKKYRELDEYNIKKFKEIISKPNDEGILKIINCIESLRDRTTFELRRCIEYYSQIIRNEIGRNDLSSFKEYKVSKYSLTNIEQEFKFDIDDSDDD